MMFYTEIDNGEMYFEEGCSSVPRNLVVNIWREYVNGRILLIVKDGKNVDYGSHNKRLASFLSEQDALVLRLRSRPMKDYMGR